MRSTLIRALFPDVANAPDVSRAHARSARRETVDVWNKRDRASRQDHVDASRWALDRDEKNRRFTSEVCPASAVRDNVDRRGNRTWIAWWQGAFEVAALIPPGVSKEKTTQERAATRAHDERADWKLYSRVLSHDDCQFGKIERRDIVRAYFGLYRERKTKGRWKGAQGRGILLHANRTL